MVQHYLMANFDEPFGLFCRCRWMRSPDVVIMGDALDSAVEGLCQALSFCERLTLKLKVP